MNSKGQTLVEFVIIVPVFILLMAFVVDTGYLLKEYTRLNSTTKTILKSSYSDSKQENYKELINDLFFKNEIPTENLKVNVDDEQIYLENQYFVESIFGQIIGLTEYQIKIEMKAYQMNNEIIVEKE